MATFAIAACEGGQRDTGAAGDGAGAESGTMQGGTPTDTAFTGGTDTTGMTGDTTGGARMHPDTTHTGGTDTSGRGH